MRILLATTSLSTILLAAAPAAAQTVTIDDDRTTPISTSTADDGAPANIVIDDDGSITVGGGSAVTLDSANDVTNDGEITISDADNSTGIHAVAGGSGTITNSGTITLDEDYEPEDDDDDDDIDGPFALGTNRVGIRVDGAFTGDIVNSGEIEIAGNESAGIRLGGTLDGSLTSTGQITVLGDNSYGIQAGDITGDVELRGAISARGENSVGVALDGDVGGAVHIQGTIAATGYRYTTPPADTDDLDADDLLQGGPAVRIAGNVGGGILLDRPPPNTDPDEDDEDGDGIPDAQEGTANLISYGSAAALEIGSANDIAIGAVGDTGHGLVVLGGVQGNGVYDGVDAVAIAIGGQGGAVDLAGGITLDGNVRTTSRANATGVLLGAGTSAPEIVNSGRVEVGGGGGEDHVARAIAIEAGATVGSISNSGVISASAATDATAIAIHDASGTLTQIDNSGTITANRGSGDDSRAIAIDLSANATGATITQALAEGENPPAPAISGEVLFGSGDDVFDVQAGRVTGTVDLGDGDNRMLLSGSALHAGALVFGSGSDELALTGTSRLQGNVDFGGGSNLLSLGEGSVLIGTLANSAGVAASVAGTLDITTASDVALGSLDVAGTGTIGVTIDSESGTATRFDVAGAATFAEGANVSVRLNGIASSLGDYVIVDAGTLVGAENLVSTGTILPILFKSELESDVDAGTVTLTIDRRTAGELGLNASESSAYDAIFDVLDRDDELSALFLGIGDEATLRTRFGSFLPEHAGGTFESIALAARASARFLKDHVPEHGDPEGWSIFGQQIAWGSSKGVGDTAAFDVGGWGVTGGFERSLGRAGQVGISLGFASGRNSDGSNDNEVLIGQYEVGAHWRARFGGLVAHVRGAIAKVDFDGQRRLYADDFSRISRASWGGTLTTASAGLSYDLALGSRLRARPQLGIDYLRLTEDGWTDAGGGEGFDLTVESRTSDEVAANALLALGYELGSLDPEGTWLRLELEGGRREIVGGALGTTTASFGGGDAFTLTPDDRQSGWLGRVRLSGGVEQFSIVGEIGAEEQQFNTAIVGRLGVRVGF